ncbi:MAG: hypothetical protein A3H28_15815 [Acidobacteria bacterium RIFCSPLOWO2_02_FULL_61_28]|nr:MAG: hypothetical protein A3H28_15815 [Acidobacteria bacterium RIFCSPLOWO2_02_FULL_61_28]
MPRLSRFSQVALLAVLLAGFPGAPDVFSQYAPGGNVLKGSVKSSDGKPLEGVAVSMRGEGKTFTTTVFTERDGTFVSPRLEKNKYQVWAQAVGFEMTKSEVQITDQAGQAALSLKPLQDYHKQLSAQEWMASLPESDSRDLRMKSVLMNNCTGCHYVGRILQNRFDSTGWAAMIKLMQKTGTNGVYTPSVNPNPMMVAYQEELAGFLAKARGPASPTLTPKLLPRPTGDAAKVVITEYDLPRNDVSSTILKHDGTDWSEGFSSRWASRAPHDIWVGLDGNIYWADDMVPEQTVGKLDPRTGKVTTYKLPDKDGHAVSTHSIVVDHKGNMWLTNQTEGTHLMFNPKTETFTRFPRPDSVPQRVGGTNAVDSKGNPWAVAADGAIKLDVATGKYTFYKAIRPGATYGIAVDSEDKVWVTFPGIDTLMVVDTAGNISEVVLPPLKTDLANDKDREVMASQRLAANSATPLQKGPRRMWADPKGNYVWVAEYFADQLARIDIHTKEVKEYPLPHRWSQPYALNVDKNHNVWINMLNRDAIAKFDPKTERFTEYQLPTRGTEIRHIVPDNSTDPPTIWVPYDGVLKIARLQFR